MAKFSEALIAENPQVEDLFNALMDLRRAAIRARPGVALMLAPELRSEPSESLELVGLDADDCVTLESNELIGILSLYGMPALPETSMRFIQMIPRPKNRV